MGIIKDTLFGGAEKKAAQAQAAATEKAMNITKEGVAEARNSLNQMHPLALQMLGGGAQQGVDLLAAAAPEAAKLIQEGNYGAQQQLAGSLPLIQSALLGQPIDFSKIQPTKMAMPNMSFLNQKVSPQINMPQEAPNMSAPQAPAQPQLPWNVPQGGNLFEKAMGGGFLGGESLRRYMK